MMKHKKQIRVILSTFGPLHLIKSADVLSRLVQIDVIQGWIPSWWNKWLLYPISKLIGYDLRKTIRKRTPQSIQGHNRGIGIADFYANACRLFCKKPETQDLCLSKANHLYGYLSKLYLHEADVFHVRSGSGQGGAIEKAKAMGMKILVDHSIAHPHFMEEALVEEFAKNKTFFNLSENTAFWQDVMDDCHKADAILVNSDFVKATFVQNGFPASSIYVVYLGVRQDFFGLKNDYNLSQERVKILFTGGFGFRKGAEYALRAMQILDQEGIDYEFVVVGNASEAKSLVEKYPISHLNLVGFVPQDELKSYLSSSDIYLFPSLCEGCASSGMEALAAGLPVISTVESGLPITDGENGYVIPAKDAGAIAAAVVRLIEDQNLRQTIGQNAASIIRSEYSWEMYANNVTKVYQSLLQ